MSAIVISILSLLAIVGLALTSLESVQTWRFTRRRTRRPFVDGLHEQASPAVIDDHKSAFRPAGFMRTPNVSILEPLCGLEDELRENLISFTALEGVSYEVILSVADSPLIPPSLL